MRLSACETRQPIQREKGGSTRTGAVAARKHLCKGEEEVVLLGGIASQKPSSFAPQNKSNLLPGKSNTLQRDASDEKKNWAILQQMLL